MPQIRKATVGVRPLKKMFRVSSLGGSIVDAVLDMRGDTISDDYFTEVATSARPNPVVRISSAKLGNSLQITNEDITFTKDFYNTGKRFHFDDFLKEFRLIWQTVDAYLKVRKIRRIGFVCEHRFSFDKTGSSNLLLSTLTTMQQGGYTERFMLNFESRTLINGERPDPEKADFVNTICSAYDSSLDAENKEEGAFNLNIDVQRYFAPVMEGKVADEFLKLYNKQYTPISRKYFEQFKNLGLLDGEAK